MGIRLGPTKQEDDQRNNENGTEYAAANVHKNLQLTESVCCAGRLTASVRCRTDMRLFELTWCIRLLEYQDESGTRSVLVHLPRWCGAVPRSTGFYGTDSYPAEDCACCRAVGLKHVHANMEYL
jgi:hypothetical protein